MCMFILRCDKIGFVVCFKVVRRHFSGEMGNITTVWLQISLGIRRPKITKMWSLFDEVTRKLKGLCIFMVYSVVPGLLQTSNKKSYVHFWMALLLMALAHWLQRTSFGCVPCEEQLQVSLTHQGRPGWDLWLFRCLSIINDTVIAYLALLKHAVDRNSYWLILCTCSYSRSFSDESALRWEARKGLR